MHAFRIGNYIATQLPTLRWQVARGSFIMSVFGTRAEAERYAKRKHDAEAANA